VADDKVAVQADGRTLVLTNLHWSQNNGSKTTVAPYSLRARDRPTVSTPVTWEEAGACRRVSDLVFTADEVPERVDALGDLFAPLLRSAGRPRGARRAGAGRRRPASSRP